MEEEQQQLPRDWWWCVESMGEHLADQGHFKRHKCLLERSRPVEDREALSNAHSATDGLGVLVASVCTREDSMQQRDETHSFHRKDM